MIVVFAFQSALTAADLARWPGISPYIPLLQHSHLQALKAFSPSSTATAVSNGIPQGSVLGPLFVRCFSDRHLVTTA